MNDQFRAEPCQVYVEQEIQDRLDDGKTAYQIGKELSDEVEELFEAKVAPQTLEKRAQRLRTKVKPVRTDKVKSVRNDIPQYRMTKERRKLLHRAEEIGKQLGLNAEDTIHNALDIYTSS